MASLFNNVAIRPITIEEINDHGDFIKKTVVAPNDHYVTYMPIEEKGKEMVWGADIKARIQLIDDKDCLFLKPKEYLLLNNQVFMIEKVIEWLDYSIYAIVEDNTIEVDANE